MTTFDDDLPSDDVDGAISIAGEKVRAANLAAILKNTLCIFEKRSSNFPDHEEIKIAFSGPGSPQAGECGKWLNEYEWETLVELAWKAQEKQLQAEGRTQKQIRTLLRRGWVWACDGILWTAREKTWTAELVPEGALEILFRYTGYAWEPRNPLITLAELKLGVTPEIDKKNHEGTTDMVFEVGLARTEKTAAFYSNSPDKKIIGQAKDLQMKCEMLREMIRKGVADPFCFAWDGVEIGKAEVRLLTLADSEMLEENFKGAAMTGRQSKWLRMRIDKACERLRIKMGSLPSIEQVRLELGVRECPCAPSELPTDCEFEGTQIPINTFKDTFTNSIRKLRKSRISTA